MSIKPVFLIEKLGKKGIMEKLPELIQFDDLDNAEDFAYSYNE